ncbi:PREDICTED: uncharacterized protein LOC107115598 [Gekko japonicus]|uniref:Uncharacterized protein LOC107115598 n=1 Tax=Gekko japonicus TaxID=146911 RepID=A0ABM1KGI8_GEKJA|nr:PREDICTED: uncharacterized protein LOC107115598 [Gekko japonicus]
MGATPNSVDGGGDDMAEASMQITADQRGGEVETENGAMRGIGEDPAGMSPGWSFREASQQAIRRAPTIQAEASMQITADQRGGEVETENGAMRGIGEDPAGSRLLEVVNELCGGCNMASIREVSSIAEDLLCSVCLSIFQEPRMLGCGHNFCLACLESCVIPKGQHQGTCPQCRCPFRLQDALCNRVLASLAEKARLLKLEEGAQSDGAGSWYFCEEHEEPLKLFCSEDEAPVCVICRDLPQHQGHRFLPIKNAVKVCQDKLKASLESLEDGMKWATNNKSRQQEAIEELESLSQHLYGHIFIEFESLRQILDAREQSMMGTVKQLKEDNQAKMEERLEYLKSYTSSHAETISVTQAALEESNEFALLKGIKELMRRIQERLEEGNGEAEPDQGAKETEEEDAKDATVGLNVSEGKGNETQNDEGEPYAEGQEAEDRDIVYVDPALEGLEAWLDFETWKEMLESITIGENDNQASPYWFPSPEEDVFQPGDGSTSEATEEETTSLEEDAICAVDVVTSKPDEAASDKPSLGSCSATALPIERVLHSQPPSPCPPNYFPVPIFQQIPLYNPVQRWGSPCSWRPNPRRGWTMMPGRGAPSRPLFWPRQGQGRAFPNTRTQHTVCSWRSPGTDTWKARGASASGPGRGWFKKQNPQPSGSNTSSQSGGGKTQSPTPRGAHVSGQGRGGPGQGRGSAHPPGRGGPGQGRGSAHPPGHGGSGQGRGSGQKGPTHHSGGHASSSKGASNRQTSHHGGRGCGSARGSQRK